MSDGHPDATARRYLPGDRDLSDAVGDLGESLPDRLRPLAALAFNYWWSWTPAGEAVFRSIDEDRFERCGTNPVRFLQEVRLSSLRAAARDEDLVARCAGLAQALQQHLTLPDASGAPGPGHVAFFCAEFGVHASLPVYAGGLGVLAGDVLKAASDACFPMIGVGLLYQHGYFRQRMDLEGRQHEYWPDIDVDRLPMVLVTGEDGRPVTVSVNVLGEELVIRVWRVEVGRVPLYLLDTDLSENRVVERWVTSRLYDGNRMIRLAQYAVLGIGGVRVLRAMGIEPTLWHLNEGHAGLATVELARQFVDAGMSIEAALQQARTRIVFTTHTPVAAGNETYSGEEIRAALGHVPAELNVSEGEFRALGAIDPGEQDPRFGMTALALELSRHANAVSVRHGEVARAMWRPFYAARGRGDVPIDVVTNGVHIGTWMAEPVQRLLDEHLGSDWRARVTDPATWALVHAIPDEELWRVRRTLRAALVDMIRTRTVAERLSRGEGLDYVDAAAKAFDHDHLTIGFARRLATYKRLHLVAIDPARASRLFHRGVQFVFAGKAHPQDEDAKRTAQVLFAQRHFESIGASGAFVEDYDMAVAATLVSGCDLWLNLPRPPQEASGTSGMKAALNGCLNLSVLDGWWAEAYSPEIGWAIDSVSDIDEAAQDRRDADALFRILEQEVIPLFETRDASGLPRGWIAKMKAALEVAGARFSAARMLDDYRVRVYGTADG